MEVPKPKGVLLKNNTNYVDLLDEDKPIAGQKFACLSFISPEDIIKQREMFFFENFVKHWDFHKSMDKYRHFMSFLSFKYKLDFDKVTADLNEFCETERDKLINTTFIDEYKTFVDAKEEELSAEFDKRHEFQTSIRGIKVRGVFPSQEEAELRCKFLRNADPNHDVYVGEVGLWMPFHPEAYKTGRVEYMEDTLNQLMSEKKTNEAEAKVEFDKRVRETKEKAILDNINKAEASGNKLTQTINDQGNLVNVATADGAASTFGIPSKEDSILTSDDIHNSIFEVDNVITDNNNNDRGLSSMSKSEVLNVSPSTSTDTDVAADDDAMEVGSVD